MHKELDDNAYSFNAVGSWIYFVKIVGFVLYVSFYIGHYYGKCAWKTI